MGVEKVTPPSSEREKKMSAFVEVPELVKVGPNCQTTYTSPSGPMAGTELCCNICVEPQFGLLGSLGVVVSGLTTAGPCHVAPLSCVRQTSICPLPAWGNPHTLMKLVTETYPLPLPSLAVAMASLS